MNGAATISSGAGFTRGDDLFDEVACLPASVYGFDLRPYRAARVQARRKRSRFGFLAAVCGGLVGALLLQSWAQHERRVELERASAIARQVDAMAPALSEMAQWQRLIDAAGARETWLEALAPRRTRLLRVFDMLSAVTRTGVRIVDMQVHQADAAGAAGEQRVPEPLDQTDASELRLHISGLADDADTLARWAADLAGQPGVVAVDLDGVHRLEDHRREPPADLSVKGTTRNREDALGTAERLGPPDAHRLNAFRLTLVWQDPVGKPKSKPVSRHAPMTSPAALATLQQRY